MIILHFQEAIYRPLEPSQNNVSRGSPRLSGGPGPLGPHRNSTTETELSLFACSAYSRRDDHHSLESVISDLTKEPVPRNRF